MNLKSSITLFSCIALFTGWASADLPKKQPIGRYYGLWTNSPFTSKPVVTGPVTGPSIFDDYALVGVSPIQGGYRVSLINKKNPEERMMIDSDNPKSKFKIAGVTRKSGDPLGTTVSLTDGTNKGTVSYDEKLLTLVSAPAKAAANPPGVPPQPGQPPGVQPQPNPNGQPQRQPRPRVVPPPAPQGVQQPQQAPQVQQAPAVQQGQPGQRNNNQRPERRRN